MATNNKKSIYRWMRILHRDIGFLLIGLTAMYVISGIPLIYRDTGIFRTKTQVEKKVAPGLSAWELGRALHIHKGFKVLSEDETTIRFPRGSYDKISGLASYESNAFHPALDKMIKLHLAPSRDARHWFTVTYAVLLLFLALSSFWMYKPGTTTFKRGLYLAGLGTLLSVVLLFV